MVIKVFKTKAVRGFPRNGFPIVIYSECLALEGSTNSNRTNDVLYYRNLCKSDGINK